MDQNDQLLSARIAEDGQWRFPERDSVPKKFELAVLSFEDRHFYKHCGFHIPSIIRAVVQNLESGRKVSGASTLTMQLIRMMRNNPRRTYSEKIIEIILATRLEFSLSKKEILSLWASHAPFGGNVVGLDAASWRYFQRRPEDLSWAESATLAVLPNAPSLIFPGKNKSLLVAKRNRLLKNMKVRQLISEEEYQLALMEELPEAPKALPQLAYHLMQSLERQKGNGKIYKTTLDAFFQSQIEALIKSHSEQNSKNEIDHACALVCRVKDGSVMAYVGNIFSNNGENASYVDLVQAPRSTGSILKPILYAGMLESGELLPDMLVSDTPVRMGSFAPTNYSESFDGVVPAGQALARSLNIPAVHLLEQYGVENLHTLLQKLGFKYMDHPPSHYGLSLILGGAEASLWEVCSAYTSMAMNLREFRNNQSKYEVFNGLKILRKQRSKEGLSQRLTEEHILGAGPIYQTFEALLEVNRPGNEEGWENFSSSVPIAWKTGTSYGFRDAWSVGCNPDFVIGVWVGNANGEGRPGLTGVKEAAPILFDILDKLPTSGWFETPYDDLEERVVCSKSGHIAQKECPEKRVAFVPARVNKSLPCSYHQRIYLDELSRKRAHLGCLNKESLVDTTWFVLSPVRAYFYSQQNATYRSIPEWHENCIIDEGAKSIQLIYPKNGQSLYLPIDNDGKKNELVLKAAYTDIEGELFWHLNNTYLGKTRERHQMSFNLKPGKYELRLIDESGSSIISSFTILEEI